MVMRGLTWASLKKNYSLIPLFVFIGGGGVWATYYLYRLAAHNPDVAWTRKNPEPWQEYEKKQYKFYSTIDHSKVEHPRPKF